MAFGTIISTRYASSYDVIAGSAVEVTSEIAWPTGFIEYGNEGSYEEPPDRTWADSISATPGGNIGLLFPLSNESIFIQDPIDDDEIRCSVKWIDRIRRI